MLKVSIAVDLYDADQEQISRFESALASKQWVKLPGPTNLFGTLIPDLASDSDVVDTAEADVAQSAESAGIYEWEGVCLLSAPLTDVDRGATENTGEL